MAEVEAVVSEDVRLLEARSDAFAVETRPGEIWITGGCNYSDILLYFYYIRRQALCSRTYLKPFDYFKSSLNFQARDYYQNNEACICNAYCGRLPLQFQIKYLPCLLCT